MYKLSLVFLEGGLQITILNQTTVVVLGLLDDG